jgi:hypothetical protein
MNRIREAIYWAFMRLLDPLGLFDIGEDHGYLYPTDDD